MNFHSSQDHFDVFLFGSLDFSQVDQLFIQEVEITGVALFLLLDAKDDSSFPTWSFDRTHGREVVKVQSIDFCNDKLLLGKGPQGCEIELLLLTAELAVHVPYDVAILILGFHEALLTANSHGVVK